MGMYVEDRLQILTFIPTGRLIHWSCGGTFWPASALFCAILIMSLGPIPLRKRIRGVPNDPADKTTRPLEVSGMTPSGPRDVSLVLTPIIWGPFRTTFRA